jgi:hypothetical protein
MKEGNIPGLPSALLKMMEPPIPIDGDEELYDNLLRELAADLQPKKMVDWIRVIRWAQCEWHSARLRRYRRLFLERHRGVVLHNQICQANNAQKKKRTPQERQALKRVAYEHLDELEGIRLDNLSAKAVCLAADDLQKLDALIDRVDRWCAIMRAECDPLFGRAMADGRIQFIQGSGEGKEVLTERDDAATVLTKIERSGEPGPQRTDGAEMGEQAAELITDTEAAWLAETPW